MTPPDTLLASAPHAPQSISNVGESRERTPWLLLVACLVTLFVPAYTVPPGPLKGYGSPAKIISLVCLLLVLIGFLLVKRKDPVRCLNPGVVIISSYFLILLLVYGVGISDRINVVTEASATRVLVATAGLSGLAIYVMQKVKSDKQRSKLLGCMLFALSVNCLIGLVQSATKTDLSSILRIPGFVVNTTIDGQVFNPVPNDRYGVQRAFGMSGHPIEFAVLAAVTVPLAAHFARYASSRNIRILAAIAACLALLGVAASVSRSGVISLVASLFIYMWVLTLRHLITALSIGALTILAVVVAPINLGSALWQTIINSSADTSVLVRIARIAKVSESFHAHPVFGLGLSANEVLDNQWLQAVLIGGAVGLAAMVILVLGCVLGWSAMLRTASCARERDQAYAVCAMSMGILASSVTFDLFAFQQVTVIFFMLIGILWSGYVVRVDAPRLSAGNARAKIRSRRITASGQ